MYYLTLDENGYLKGYAYDGSEELIPDLPAVESLDGLNLEDANHMNSYHWDGEKLTLDEDRLAELQAKDAAALAAEKQAVAKAAVMQEAQELLVTAQINTLDVDNTTALRLKILYPQFETVIGKTIPAGFKVQDDGDLYESILQHTVQSDWTPHLTPGLWKKIDEAHAGTLEDPISYDGNMVLEQGKYYIQAGVVYLCTRDTVNPVYNALSDLIGLYVERVE